jgi:aminopeptidase N
MRFLVIMTLFLMANLSDGQRIGSLVRPVHYDLALLPIISGDGPRLCGHVFIDLEPTTTTNLVTLHGADIVIIDVSVEQVFLVAGNESAKSNSSSSDKDRFLLLEDLCFSGLYEPVNEAHTVIQEEPEKQQLNIILKEILIKGNRYRLGLFYVAKVNDDSRGFFRANYRNDNTSCCIQGYTLHKSSFFFLSFPFY